MNEEQQIFSSLLHRAAALWRVGLDERLRPWGMTQATWRTLLVLRMAEARYNQTTLAERLGIETPTLVRLLDRMEKLGLVRREADVADRRQKYVVITGEGLKLAEELEGEVVAMRNHMLQDIPPELLQAGIQLLEAVVINAVRPPEP